MKKTRARQAGKPVSRDTESRAVAVAVDEDQQDYSNNDTDEQIRERGLLYRAEEALRLAEYEDDLQGLTGSLPMPRGCMVESRRAMELIALAKAETTQEEIRAKANARKIKYRASQASPFRNGHAENAPPVKPGNVVKFPERKRDATPMGDHLEGTRAERTGSFMNMIREAHRLAVFEKNLSTLSHFGELASSMESLPASVCTQIFFDQF